MQDVALDPKFVPSTLALDPGDAQRVWKAVEQYGTDPNSPSLRLERLRGRAGHNRLWSIRASDELRVLLARQGSVSVLLRAGHHDAIYDLANRCAFVAPVAGRPGLIPLRRHAVDLDGPAEADAPAPPTATTGDRQPSILEHWSTGELAEAGFDHATIELLRRATSDNLLDVWPDIDEGTLSKVLELIELSPEEWRQGRFPDDELANERFRDAIVKWSDPARVRGSAGTAKTVFVLHRAAALAKRFAGGRVPVLFTTFVKQPPARLRELYRKLRGY